MFLSINKHVYLSFLFYLNLCVWVFGFGVSKQIPKISHKTHTFTYFVFCHKNASVFVGDEIYRVKYAYTHENHRKLGVTH